MCLKCSKVYLKCLTKQVVNGCTVLCFCLRERNKVILIHKVGNWGRLGQFWFILGCLLLNTTANVWKGHQWERMKSKWWKMKVPSCCWQARNWCRTLQRWIYLAISKIGLDKWVWTKNFINGLLGIRKNFRGDFTILLEDTNFLIRVRVFFHFFFLKKTKKKKKKEKKKKKKS